MEEIDSARYLSNRSSGKMGVLIAQAAKFRGGEVDLVHGQLQIDSSLLEGLNHFETRSSQKMSQTLQKLQPSANAIAMAAAIVDIRSKNDPEAIKLSKENLYTSLKDRFEIVPDVLSKLIAQKKRSQIFLGFSAMTGNDEEIKRLAKIKKKQKGCDLLFANPIDRKNQGFESDFNGGWLLGPNEKMHEISKNFKFSIAHKLLDELKILLTKQCNKD